MTTASAGASGASSPQPPVVVNAAAPTPPALPVPHLFGGAVNVGVPYGAGIDKGQIKALMSNLNPNRVANRQQSGSKLSYLEAWDVKAALIRVFGFGGFSAEVLGASIVRQERVANSKGTGENWKVTAQATVRLTIHAVGAVYTETAIGGSSQPDFTESADMAIKTAESDALKRAAIYLGTQFGLSLYDNGSTNDVIRVLLEPNQAELLAEARGTSPTAPATAPGTPQEGEDMLPPETAPEALSEAQEAVKRGFGGGEQ